MKAKQAIIIGLSICAVLLIGCASTPQAYERQNNLQMAMTPGPDGLPGDLPGDLGGLPGAGSNSIFGSSPAPYGATAPVPNRGESAAQLCPPGAAPDSTRADNIKYQLAGLKEIQDVNVVVIGNSCLVGYTPTESSTDPNATKDLVAARCKQADSNIAGVTCGDTPDINSQIAGINSDLQTSKPAGDMSSRFNDIVKVINPNLR